MSLLSDDRKKSNWGWITAPFFILMFLFLSNLPEWELRYKTGKVVTRSDPIATNVVEKIIRKEESKPDSLHSRIFQLPFSQDGRISGRSGEELSIRFEAPAKIHGILVSVDCWKSTRLVEFAAGINQKPAYQTGGDSDMLIHASCATNALAGKIDEQAFFPVPFSVVPTDAVNIGAWIQNISDKKQAVSPEIIVYYTWAAEAPPPRRFFSQPAVLNPLPSAKSRD